MAINVFAGIRAKMGEEGNELTYYMIKMKASELVGFLVKAEDLEGNPELAKRIQRNWKENRSTGAIAKYLSSAHEYGERFLGSFVIATFGGDPMWDTLEFTSTNAYAKKLADSDFGVFTVDGTQDFFVLDGQHRLESLKHLIIGDGGKKKLTPPPA